MATFEEILADVGERWSVFRQAPTIIDEKFEDGRTYAADALTAANATIEDLRLVATTLNTIDTSTSITEIAAPIIPDLTTSLPSSPDATFAAPSAPTVGEPSGVLPSSPDVNFGTQTVPSVREPTAILPVSPNITLNLPSAPSDTDSLQAEILSKLINDISTGSPAISSAVETAIFDRETERAIILHQSNLDNISSEWSKRGFTLPNAILAAQLAQAETEYANKRLDISRDIAIKNFELSDVNVKFAISQGLVYIQNKIGVYKVAVDAEIARIESILKKYLGDTDNYKASVQKDITLSDLDIKLFASKITAESARIDPILKKYAVDVDSYRASAQAFGIQTDADVKLYSTEVQAEATRIDSILKKYSGDIDNYRASYQSIASMSDLDVKLFEAEVKQEVIKAELLIKNVDTAIKNFEVENNLKIEADKAIGGINAQIVAGALASVSASVSISASNAGNYSYPAPSTIAKTVRDEVAGEVYGVGY